MRDDRPERTREALKLRAESTDDLRVVAACLQDAIVPVADVEYLAAERAFVLVANRFRWESDGPAAGAEAQYERVLCGVTFDDVGSVRSRNIDRSQPGGFLNLLTIEAASDEDAGWAIELTFSHNACVRLLADRLSCRLEDFGEPWPTQWRPQHEGGSPPGER